MQACRLKGRRVVSRLCESSSRPTPKVNLVRSTFAVWWNLSAWIDNIGWWKWKIFGVKNIVAESVDRLCVCVYCVLCSISFLLVALTFELREGMNNSCEIRFLTLHSCVWQQKAEKEMLWNWWRKSKVIKVWFHSTVNLATERFT